MERDRVPGGTWVVYPESGSILLGASNLRRGLSPLQTELEALVWAMQSMLVHNKRRMNFQTDYAQLGEWCQVDGAWKETESRAGLGWYNFDPESGSILLGPSNLQRGLSPLQTELEALVWAMQSMLVHNKRRMNFQTDCAQLVKMVSKPAKWPAFEILLEEVEKCRRKFQVFSLTHIPRIKKYEGRQASTECSRSAS
ncbi:unnamed protein product [Microthlaspi erraticum]|uniref:RNase H type-1 domain-containing protein n=1 Tax=Microthlaspi erraticum TaxID=1685480 RepID=A0A6D2JZU3_9BRAS|nr:unnamed protein product [Microthlaspi erraticum]